MSEWPVALEGLTETVITTRGPEGRWNAAALGVTAGEPATARTWGRTRTRLNLDRTGEGYVLLLDDPVVFTEAALSVLETEAPVLDAAAAWTRVTAETTASGESDGTGWVDWALRPTAGAVRERTVPRFRRGRAAVVEATVAASRLAVPAYDRATLVARLAHLARVVDRCGTPADDEAMARIRGHSGWEPNPDVPVPAPVTDPLSVGASDPTEGA